MGSSGGGFSGAVLRVHRPRSGRRGAGAARAYSRSASFCKSRATEFVSSCGRIRRSQAARTQAERRAGFQAILKRCPAWPARRNVSCRRRSRERLRRYRELLVRPSASGRTRSPPRADPAHFPCVSKRGKHDRMPAAYEKQGIAVKQRLDQRRLVELRARGVGIEQRLHRSAKHNAVVVFPDALQRLDHHQPAVHGDLVEIAIGLFGYPPLLDDMTVDGKDDRHASDP